MQINKIQKSEGDEVLQHIDLHKQQYIQQNSEPNSQRKESQTTLQTLRPITFEEIQLVSSLQETADGQIYPVRILCKGCKKNITTKITSQSGSGTYKAGCLLLLCSFGLICLACLPCMMEDCKDVIHSCPECGHINGKTSFKLCN